MADPRFFDRSGPFTLEEIARLCDATLLEKTMAGQKIDDVAPLDQAGSSQLSFLDNRKYRDQFLVTKAGACLVHPDFVDQAPSGCAILVSQKPYRSYALAAQAFYPLEKKPVSDAQKTQIHPSAIIDPSAEIGDGCIIAAGAVIGRLVKIGQFCRLDPHVVIEKSVEIGNYSWIGAGVTVSHAIIGSSVRLFPGVRIGQDGFGYAMDAAGHVKVPQLGRVIIEDNVEIGSNSTIDRGAGPDTVIGRGTIIDNLVQIGHNVQIGSGSVLVAQCGIAGSSKLGRFSVIAAQGGIAGHIIIGDGGVVGAQSGVMRDVSPGHTVMGSPAMPAKSFWRQVATLERLSKKREG